MNMNTLPTGADSEERLAFHQNVRETLTRYLEVFPDETDRLSALRANLDNPELDLRLRTTIPEGHMCASGIILLGRKVLMLEHKGLGIWVVPGGHFDLTDKELYRTAMRETSEEAGIHNLSLHPWHREHKIPLDIDIHPIPHNEKKNEGAHQHIDFRYVLEMTDSADDITLDPNEVLAHKFVDIDEIDLASSIAPAIMKLGLLDQ
jgi:8-oxo-dGTP pyrophosphatase MutT (NUDIX family)